MWGGCCIITIHRPTLTLLSFKCHGVLVLNYWNNWWSKDTCESVKTHLGVIHFMVPCLKYTSCSCYFYKKFMVELIFTSNLVDSQFAQANYNHIYLRKCIPKFSRHQIVRWMGGTKWTFTRSVIFPLMTTRTSKSPRVILISSYKSYWSSQWACPVPPAT